MAINESTIDKARYYPELIPDARIVSALAGQEVAPPILDFRRFRKFLRLANISVEQSADATLRIRNDKERDEISCAGLPNLSPGSWDVLATDFLFLNIYAVNDLTNFRTTFGLWIWEPTVSDKIKAGKPLTPEENKLAQKLNLKETVEKGLLPLPINYQIEREYQLIDRKTYVYAGAVSPVERIIQTLPSKPGEFLILESIACSPGLVTDNILIRIDRDNDSNYVEIPAYPLSLATDLACWIPALYELKIKVVANTTTTMTLRYVVGRYVLSNILRVRFGLLSKAEAPEDLYDKVKGGVL